MKNLFLLIPLVLCSACGKDTTGPSPAAGAIVLQTQNDSAVYTITGTSYQTSCKDYRRNTITINDSQIVLSSVAYTAEDCSGKPSITNNHSYTYVFSGNDRGHASSQKIDLILRGSVVVLGSKQIVSLYNRQHTCGFTNWSLGNAKDVLGTECSNYAHQGDTIFSIMQIGNNKLRLGIPSKAHGGETADTRMDDLDMDEIFYKQARSGS